jgi:hypothetical protein
MTEAEWLACTEPKTMLEFLRGTASDRKLRLFAVACCRRMWNLLKDERSREAVAVAGRYADGLATEKEREEAADAADAANRLTYFAAPAAAAIRPDAVLAAEGASELSAAYAVDADAPSETELAAQATMLRDIIGNPFRPVALDPAWRTPTVTALATAAYEERHLPTGTLDTQRLAILADALEDAGCDNGDILSHLRGPGPHVRGCWAVDLLLGKE